MQPLTPDKPPSTVYPTLCLGFTEHTFHIHIEQYFHLVGTVIVSFYPIGYKAYRPPCHIPLFGHGRGYKIKPKMQVTALKHIVCLRGLYIHILQQSSVGISIGLILYIQPEIH